MASDRFRGTVPLLLEISDLPNPTSLVALETWEDWFAVRVLERVPDVAPPPDAQRGQGGWFASAGDSGMRLPADWVAEADAGTRHAGALSGGHGGGERHWHTLEFTPGLPSDAQSVTFTAGASEVVATLSGWPGEERMLRAQIGERTSSTEEAHKDSVRRVVAAYSTGTEVLSCVVPLNASLGEVLGGHTWLLSIDSWSTWFDLHYRQYPFIDMRPELHGDWEAEDDLGNRYVGFGNAAAGVERGWFGTLSFAPELDPSARSMELVLDGGRLQVEVPIRAGDPG